MSYKFKYENGSIAVPTDALLHILRTSESKDIKYLCALLLEGASYLPLDEVRARIIERGDFDEKEADIAEAYLCGAGILTKSEKNSSQTVSQTQKKPIIQKKTSLPSTEESSETLTSDAIKRWMQEDTSRQDFVKACEDVYGNVFNKTELMTVITYSQEYRLQDECILAILGYSRENGYGIAYTRKLFSKMVENNINTLEGVNAELSFLSEHSSYVTNIKQIFGLSRALSSSEKPKVERWHKEFKFTKEMIQLAFDKAASMKGDKATIAYCDKILTSWREEGLLSADDVRAKINSSKNQISGKIQSTYSLSDFFNAAVERSYSDDKKSK